MQRHSARGVAECDRPLTKDIRRIFFLVTCDVTTVQRAPAKCVSKRLRLSFCIALSRASYIIAARISLRPAKKLAWGRAGGIDASTNETDCCGRCLVGDWGEWCRLRG